MAKKQKEQVQENQTLDIAYKRKTKTFKCDSCGYILNFDPATQKLKCEHCGTIKDIKDIKLSAEQPYDDYKEDENTQLKQSYKCSSCGANVVADKQISNLCPFCGSSNVVFEQSNILLPNAVIPFAFDKQKAAELYKKWIKRKIFVPFKLKKNFKVDSIKGMYLPGWTFDMTATGSYEGRFGKRYTYTVRVGDRNVVRTEIRWYYVSGKINHDFDDILIYDSERINDKQIKKIGDFDTNNAIAFKEEVLAGFQAEVYNEGMKPSFVKARDYADEYLRRQILNKYCPDVVDYLNIDVGYFDVTYKYVLLPLWICAYKYKKKEYGFIINGQHGKMQGKTPRSFIQIAITSSIIILAIVLIVLYFLGYI